MKSSSELHELIHALSMNEKRHFKLLSQRHEGKEGNSYVDLFDTLLGQPEYDEKALKQNLDKAGKLRFATEKNYLQNLVIDSLIHFHRGRPSIAVYQKLISLDVLAEKKLFRSCLKVARKGKAETLKLEKLFPALSFIRWEASLLSFTGGMADIDTVIQEERTVIALMDVQAQIMQLSFRIRNLLAAGKVQQTELNSLVTDMNKVMKRAVKEKTRTFLTIYYYHSALATAAAFYANQEERKKNYALIHDYLGNHPWFISDIPHIYNSNINNIVNTCIALGQFDEAMSWIRLQRTYMDKYKLKSEAMSARIFLNTHEAEIQIYSRRNDFRKGIPLVKAIEQGLRKFGEYYQGEQYDLILSLALLLFGGKDLRGSARWLNRIASVRTTVQPVPEVLVTAKLLLLVIHFLNKESNLAYQLKSMQRWLGKNGYFRSGEAVVRFLEAMHEKSTAREKKLRCITEWNAFRKLKEDPNEMLLSKYFDFEAWMKKAAELRSPNP
jgi:hypothetical protein